MASRLSDGMAALRRAYVAQLGPAIAEISKEWTRFRAGEDGEAATRLQRAVHRLAGSGATFGFPSVSKAAADLEDRLDHVALDSGAVDGIDRGLARLEKAARRIERSEKSAATPRTSDRAA